MRRPSFVLAGLLVAACHSSAPAAEIGPPPVPLVEAELTVGDPAPALDVADWPLLRDAAAAPLTEIPAGEITVVEFWATWCGPCVANIPHLGDLADEYAGKVRFVSVSSEEPGAVGAFLDKPSRVARPAPAETEGDETAAETEDGEGSDTAELPPTFTYGELAAKYDVGVDPDRSTSSAYMSAALESGIPNAFVVGREGLVEWVGHPARLDDVLAAVVGGTWDRAAFAEEYAAEQRGKAASLTLRKLVGEDRTQEAVLLADWLVGSAETPRDRVDPLRRKADLLTRAGRYDDAEATLGDLETAMTEAGFGPAVIGRLSLSAWGNLTMLRLANAEGAEATDATVRAVAKIASLGGYESRRMRTTAVQIARILAVNAPDDAETRTALAASLDDLAAAFPEEAETDRAAVAAAKAMLTPEEA